MQSQVVMGGRRLVGSGFEFVSGSFHSTRSSSGGFPSEMSASDWVANGARFTVT